MRKVNESYKRTRENPPIIILQMSSLAMHDSCLVIWWVILDKWPIIDSIMSKAYPGTIPMIKHWGGDNYDLFGFDLEVGDENHGGGVQRRRVFLTFHTLLHNMLHYQLGLFASFLKICMVQDMFQIGLYLLWHELFWGLVHLTELRGGWSREGSLMNIGKTKMLKIE